MVSLPKVPPVTLTALELVMLPPVSAPVFETMIELVLLNVPLLSKIPPETVIVPAFVLVVAWSVPPETVMMPVLLLSRVEVLATPVPDTFRFPALVRVPVLLRIPLDTLVVPERPLRVLIL